MNYQEKTIAEFEKETGWQAGYGGLGYIEYIKTPDDRDNASYQDVFFRIYVEDYYSARSEWLLSKMERMENLVIEAHDMNEACQMIRAIKRPLNLGPPTCTCGIMKKLKALTNKDGE